MGISCLMDSLEFSGLNFEIPMSDLLWREGELVTVFGTLSNFGSCEA